ncbi:MAG TPA: hypothetical protein VFT53_01085 [Candidatus Saccharimonadales bacterium]|nr:hypothetical protein [Candidatus Saccharimonadales bacterium]
MKRLRSTFIQITKRIAYSSLAVLLVMLAPAPYVFADGADSTAASASTSCTPVVATPGIKSPTGSDAGTYTFNTCTGLWENQYYTWSPATKGYTPKVPYVYTCNTAQWDWTYTKWIYNPVAGKYVQVPLTVSTLPDGATIADGSPTVCTPPPPTPVVSTPNAVGGNAAGVGATGATTNATGVTITNGVSSTAGSGNAIVAGNTSVDGGAVSGAATVTANVINNVASSSSLSGGNVVTFTANVNGDVQGDLIIDPNQIQPASGSEPLASTTTTVNSTTNASVTNNLTLNANSGNATVADNTSAGGATSGNAQAIANVINILNSVVTSGKSFVGVININGNLHGNILMPQSFLDELLATNAPHTNMTISASDASTLGITNNVNNSATTGSATVTGNTEAGGATSGNASTAVTIFNLTGSEIVGTNCLLVFVNVSGHWVGVIMNAPAGTTAAALGGNATQTANANVAADTNASITNNIDVNAKTGNAAVTDNTKAGGATSGNASTVVNLLNLENSQLNLAGWFGVLFINVFGNWFGNFGVYTPATHAAGQGAGDASQQPMLPAAKPAFQFVPPHVVPAPRPSPADAVPSFVDASAHLATAAGQALGTSVGALSHGLQGTPTASAAKGNPVQLVGGIMVAVGLVTLAVERAVSARQMRKPVTTVAA